MVESERCPSCGGTVTAGSLEGLCARCLLVTALHHAAEPGLAALPVAGQRLGGYRIERLLGEGGMGVVYLARQEGAVSRQVAIKVIGPGILHPKAVQRFQDERQILGTLDHPNIARLLDGGVTGDGVPYMAMEYVAGVSITEHCARARLPLRERLKLFRIVCLAVHHAHQHLVVHRDIKPANILVRADGVPSLLDFGIAKMLDPIHGVPAVTGTLLRPMTPGYASPEQLRGAAVTTATDIYSLGVVLYELLAGTPPYELTHVTPAEAIRIVNEGVPRKPGAHPGGSALGVSADLDSIVLKAMRREPPERYASGQELADEISRYLQGLPVLARRGSAGYLVRELIARHKGHAAAIAAGLVLLTAGVAATGWQAHVANQQRAQAVKRFSQLRSLAKSVIFELHDGIARLPGSTAVRKTLVTRALAYLDSLAADSGDDIDILTELAAAYRRMGDVQGRSSQANLGDPAAALVSYHKGLAAVETALHREPGDDGAIREAGWLNLLMGEIYIGNHDTPNATRYVQEGLALLRQRADAPGASKAAHSDLAAALLDTFLAVRMTDAAAAQGYLKQAAEIYERLLSLEPKSGNARMNVALAHRYLAAYSDRGAAIGHLRRSLELDRSCANAEPSDAEARLNLAIDLSEMARLDEAAGDTAAALAGYRESLAIRQELAQTDPANTLGQRRLAYGYGTVAQALLKTGDPAGAAANGEKAATIYQALSRANSSDREAHGRLVDAYATTGNAERQLGHDQKACSLFRRGAETLASLTRFGPDDAWVVRLRDETSRGLAACNGPPPR